VQLLNRGIQSCQDVGVVQRYFPDGYLPNSHQLVLLILASRTGNQRMAGSPISSSTALNK